MTAAQEPEDVTMADAAAATPPSVGKSSSSKNLELFSCTISKPAFAYAQLELASSDPGSAAIEDVDALQFRSHCTSALNRFLGATGTAIPLDILKVQGAECWIRVPREDLGAFAAAITAWPGVKQGSNGASSVLRLRASGNWLGSLLGRSEQHKLWDS